MLTKLEFKNLTSNIQVTHYLDVKEYLNAVYKHIKKDLSKYSYHLFTEHLGMEQSSLSHLIITGKRNISNSAAESMVKHLGLVKLNRRYFLKLVEMSRAKSEDERDNALSQLIKLKAESAKSKLGKDALNFFVFIDRILSTSSSVRRLLSLTATYELSS